MPEIEFAAVQFEHRDGDKSANLARIEALARSAHARGAQFVVFHECSLVGYTVLQTLGREQIGSWAEPVPGPSTELIRSIATDLDVPIGVGLLERADDGRVFNTYVVVGPEGLLAKHRKLNDFISPHISNGDSFTLFEHSGMRIGILTCYDNNLPENVRITALMGAEVVLMPHVTGCTPSEMPGRGPVDRNLWENRAFDPKPLRKEFDGPKGRAWLMRWLPARCWENGVAAVFANAIGVDHDTIKPGLAMILDHHGEVLDECRALDDGFAIATITSEAYQRASGRRYLAARRPELYAKLVEPHPPGSRPLTKPGWALQFDGEK